jgi:hypothetical protein
MNIEIKLTKLTGELRDNRQENEFVETDLDHWKEKLIKLEEEFTKSPNISIQHDSTSFIHKISAQISGTDILISF